MHKISDEIESRKLSFLNHDFFKYLTDADLPIEKRLKFLPYISHFVMSFSDINKIILPFETPKNELENVVNNHALEDAEHWPWYLKDLENLDLNPSTELTEHLRFLWSNKLIYSRKLTYQLIQSLHNQTAEMRLIVIEVMEATGNATFDTLARITQDTDKELEYCGNLHLSHETGHSIGSKDELIDTLQLTEDTRAKAINLINECFEAFHRFFDEVLRNAMEESPQQLNK
ncbi:TPA: hypothetical protein ACW7NQ_001018 [Enterobacter ludwigii]